MDLTAGRKPWELLALDTLSFLPRSQNGYRYILAVVDVASRWLELLPLRSKDPLEMAFVLEQNIFLSFGPSSAIILPNSQSEFEGSFLKILKKYEVTKWNTEKAPPHVMTMVNRILKGAKKSLQEMMREYSTVPWDHLLKHVSYKFRMHRHSNMKTSPLKMILKFRKEVDDDAMEQEQDQTMEVEKNKESFASGTGTIRAQRDCRSQLARERDWFQTNVERFRGLSLSLKAEALRSKMLLDPSALPSFDGGPFATPMKKKTSFNRVRSPSRKGKHMT